MSAVVNQVTKPDHFITQIEKMKPEIARALPAHLNADRMSRIVLTEFRKNPKLGQCEPKSVFASIIMASQMGLEPGIGGQAYLVPYWNNVKKIFECQLIPGWQGINDLVSRAGRATCWTGAVYVGDKFDYAMGDKPFVEHRPGDDVDQNPKNLQYVYAIGRVKGAEWPIVEVWSANKVAKHRDKYNKVGDKHYSYDNFEMYGRKVVLLQVAKYLPKSIELQRAADLEHSAQRGSQGIDVSSAIEGTWAPVDDGDGTDGAGDNGARAESMKDRMRSEPAGKQGDAPTPDVLHAEALNLINGATTAAGLERVWKQIVEKYTAANVGIPVNVEATRNDRRAVLTKQL